MYLTTKLLYVACPLPAWHFFIVFITCISLLQVNIHFLSSKKEINSRWFPYFTSLIYFFWWDSKVRRFFLSIINLIKAGKLILFVYVFQHLNENHDSGYGKDYLKGFFFTSNCLTALCLGVLGMASIGRIFVPKGINKKVLSFIFFFNLSQTSRLHLFII